MYVPELDEHYHSVNGAVQESEHVFIGMGLKAIERERLSILEAGFGTGLNAILSFKEASESKKINYHTLEKYPLGWEEVKKMHYADFLKLSEKEAAVFRNMHDAAWGTSFALSDYFSICKVQTDLRCFESEDVYDLVYFDAFAPEVQPELWEEEVFSHLFEMMSPGGLLVTYCAKGEVRRRMGRAGFLMERLPGPPGKREMLRAQKPVR